MYFWNADLYTTDPQQCGYVFGNFWCHYSILSPKNNKLAGLGSSACLKENTVLAGMCCCGLVLLCMIPLFSRAPLFTTHAPLPWDPVTATPLPSTSYAEAQCYLLPVE